MAFFFSGLAYNDVMVAGVREGFSKAGKPFLTLTVVDAEGNTNSLSTSEPDTMDICRNLKQGDKVDLRIVCAGGPQKQYAMIARGVGSVQLHGVAGY